MTEKRSRNALPIYLTVFASFFDTHAQLPILALFAVSLGADSLGVGTVIGIYSLFNIIGNGIGGSAIDRLGWRRPMLWGLLGVTLTLYGYLLVGSTPVLVLVRGLHGLTGGILIPATLASLSPRSGNRFALKHSRRVAFYGLSIGLAALTGPPLAGIISARFSFQAAYLGIALLMTAASVFVFFYTRGGENPASADSLNWARAFRLALPPLPAAACLMAFALMGGTGSMAAFMPVLAASRGFSQAGIGMLFGLFALTVIILQLYRAAANWPRSDLFVTAMTGASILAAALLLIHGAVNPLVFAAAMALYGLGFGVIFPTILTMVMRGASEENRGLITGVFFAFYSLGAAVVPPVGGWLWREFPSVTPLLTAAIILLLSIPWVNRYRRRVDS